MALVQLITNSAIMKKIINILLFPFISMIIYMALTFIVIHTFQITGYVLTINMGIGFIFLISISMLFGYYFLTIDHTKITSGLRMLFNVLKNKKPPIVTIKPSNNVYEVIKSNNLEVLIEETNKLLECDYECIGSVVISKAPNGTVSYLQTLLKNI